MFSLVKSYLDYGMQLFKNDPYLLVILLAILMSWSVTQGIKKNIFPDVWSDKKHKQATWTTAIVSGTWFSLLLWHYKEELGVPTGIKENPFGFDLLCSVMIGIASPSLHWLVTRVLYWKWPTLEASLSNRSSSLQPVK